MPAGLSCELDQYLTLHTANKEAMGWNLISLGAIHGQVAVHEREPFGSSQIAPTALNWAQRDGVNSGSGGG